MRFILAIDSALLKFFGKVARAFSRLTGRSNFFLAKCMVIIFNIGLIIVTLNYWFPVLGQKTDAVTAGMAAFAAFTSLSYFPLLCDRAEETTSQGVKMFGPLLYSPFFRMFIVFTTVIDVSIRVPRVIFANEFLLAKLIDGVMGPAYAAFLYFANLDPPRVDKSKIREWAEGFANLFRKPAAIPVKNSQTLIAVQTTRTERRFRMRDYPTLKALQRGEVVDIGGILLKMDEGEIKPGDLYVAERNTDPHLLTARVVDTEANCIHPVDFPAYSFDILECVKVVEA